MSVLIGITLLVLFALSVYLIMRGESPIIVLLSLAILWAALAGNSLMTILTSVLQRGAEAYASAVVIIAFGAWFGQTLVQTGIAESVIRSAVELAGDRPAVALATITVVVGFLFTSMYGVGAAIAVGVIALPILMSMGVPPAVAGTAFTMSMGGAYAINLVQFNVYKPLFKAEYEPYFLFYVFIVAVWLLATVAMGAVHLQRAGTRKYSAVGVAPPLRYVRVPWYAYGTPLVPVLMVMGFHWPMVPAFLLAIAYALVTTGRGRTGREAVGLFHKTFYDAFPDIAAVVALYVICGMLISAGQLPSVQTALTTVFGPFLPSSRLGLVVFFAVLTPFALYRGPFSVVGTGAALLAIFLSAGHFSGAQLYPLWLCTLMVAQSLDPTVSWNLWTIGYTKITHRQFLGTGLPFAWLAVIVNLLIGYAMIAIP
jgi:Gnt-I system high-affinity gluconate transporter